MPRNPFYLIAHRANGLDDIDLALDAGANAVECDARRSVVDHAGAFPWSTRLDAWLDRAARRAARDPRFCLVYLDVKDPDALDDIAAAARERLPPGLGVLYSIAGYNDREAFASLRDSRRSNERLTIDGERDPLRVARYLGPGGTRPWYSFGVPARRQRRDRLDVRGPIERAVAMRDEEGRFERVLVWTLTEEDLMAQYLALGVDGMLVERKALSTLRGVLAANPSVRPATAGDPPFG